MVAKNGSKNNKRTMEFVIEKYGTEWGEEE